MTTATLFLPGSTGVRQWLWLPLVTLANGPLMAQRSCQEPQPTGAVRTALRALRLRVLLVAARTGRGR
jgi:hypothetical protein